MNRVTGWLGAIVLLAATLTLVTGGDSGFVRELSVPATGEQTLPTKVLFYGDSIVEGSATWPGIGSIPLATSLVGAADRENFEFVGSRSGTRFGSTGLVSAVKHEGVTGRTADAALTDQPFSNGLTSAIAASAPDIVVIALGTNDLLRGAAASEVAESLEALGAVALEAGVDHVVLVSPTPIRARPGLAAQVADLLGDRVRGQSSVVLVPVASFLEPSSLFDGVHPDAAGQIRIAGQIALALTGPQ